MTSRYSAHAKLIEDLFEAGDSYTSIGRHLEEKFGLALDSSGLRRWLLRRLSKREQRARLAVAPTPCTPQLVAPEKETRTKRAARNSQLRNSRPESIALKSESGISRMSEVERKMRFTLDELRASSHKDS